MTSLTVHEDEPEVIDTGLLDKRGNPIYRVQQLNPIGFVNHDSDDHRRCVPSTDAGKRGGTLAMADSRTDKEG